jgi:hypothetical protein
LGELEKLSEKVVVSEAVVERAAYIYRKSIPLTSARGRSITTLVAASLYAACRSTQTPRTLKDIGDAANLDRLDIARSYRLLVTESGLLQPVTDPSKRVLISMLGLDPGLFDDTRAWRKAAPSSALAMRGNPKELPGLPRKGSPGQPILETFGRVANHSGFRSSAQDAGLPGLSDWTLLFSLCLGGQSKSSIDAKSQVTF